MNDTGIRVLMIIGWTAVLPLVGFSVFAILTILPLLFGGLLGPRLLWFIYAAGAVPAFVTAAAFEFRFRHWGLVRSLLVTVTLGATMSILWLAAFALWEGERPLVGADYVTFALGMAGALTAALMPITRFAKDRRRWH